MSTLHSGIRPPWWRQPRSERPVARSTNDVEAAQDRSARIRRRPSLSLPFITPGACDQEEFDRVTLAIVSVLLCRACGKVPRQGVALPCGHSICRACMEEPPHLTLCSTCQDDYPASAFHLWSFPDNPLPGHLVRRLSHSTGAALGQGRGWWSKAWRAPKATPSCGLCNSDNSAHRFCATCELNYCRRCLKEKHVGDKFRTHTLSGTVPDGQNPCRCRRDAVQTHYCFTDHTGVCEGCVENSHLDHDMTSVDDALHLKTAFVQSVVDMAERAHAKCSGEVRAVEDRMSQVTRRAESLERKLKHGFAALHSDLRAQEKHLRSKIKEQVRRAQLKGEAFVERAQAELSSLDSLLLVSKEAKKEQNPVVFLKGADSLGRILYGAIGKLYCLGKGAQLDALKDVALDFHCLQQGLKRLLEKHLLCPSSDTLGWVEGRSRGPPQQEEQPAHVGAAMNSESNEAGREPLEPPLRAPTIYQHYSNGCNTKVFWTVPVGAEVETFDVQFQDTRISEVGRGGARAGGSARSVE